MEETEKMRPLRDELLEMDNRLAVLERRAKRLEREIRILEIRADEHEKEVLLWKTIWSIFGNNKQENNEQPIKK